MGQVSVPVNGRSYAITCEDGQETRIRRLAQYVDAKVAEFVGSVGQVGEARLLLLAALVVADELSDANDALERERNHAANRVKWKRRTGETAHAYCGGAADTLASRMRSGAGRCVRPHVAPGPIPTSWGPSLSKSWLRHMVAHLLRRATEELHADGRAGSTSQAISRLGAA